MSDIKIISLPKEILEKIFIQLPLHEIPELTEVCKKFNHVIGDSIKLMDAFEVQWKKCRKGDDLRPLIQSERKYRKITIMETPKLKDSLKTFISDHSNTLTSISLCESALKSSEFQYLLDCVKDNLTIFTMCEVNIEKDSEVDPIKLVKLDYLEIMYCGGDGFFSILNFFTDAPNVTNFSYEDDSDTDHNDVENFVRMVANMSKLTHLQICSTITQKIFANNDLRDLAKFKLKKMYALINAPQFRSQTEATDINYRYLFNFVSSQCSTLKDLNLVNSHITSERLEFLLRMNLRKLSLVQTKFSNYHNVYTQNNSIESLFLSTNEEIDEDSDDEKILCDLMKNCINTTSIRFVCTGITFEICLTMAHKMENLKNLSLYQCDIVPIHIPTLKTFSVASGDHDHDETIRFIRLNRQIQNLSVPSCFQDNQKFIAALGEIHTNVIKYS